MKLLRLLCPVIAVVVASPAGSSAAARDPLLTWFGSQTCPALDGLYSKKEPPYVKTGTETLIVNVPTAVLLKQKGSMTVPWYVYDPKTNVALSHVGGDSGVVWTLRVVKGPPPTSLSNVDLSGAHTTSGLKIGASAESVVRVAWEAAGHSRLRYGALRI